MIKIDKYRGKCFTDNRYVEGQLIVSPGPCNKGKYYILQDLTSAYSTEIRGLIFGEFLEVDPETVEEVQ